jgi:hypothetical protein
MIPQMVTQMEVCPMNVCPPAPDAIGEASDRADADCHADVQTACARRAPQPLLIGI